jgi:hypothetical protein
MARPPDQKGTWICKRGLNEQQGIGAPFCADRVTTRH